MVLLILPTPTARSHVLEPVMATPSPIAVWFPHEKHTEVNCLACHHNLLDNTGLGNCIAFLGKRLSGFWGRPEPFGRTSMMGCSRAAAIAASRQSRKSSRASTTGSRS